MNSKEKQLLKKTLVGLAVILLLYGILQLITSLTLGKDYKDYVFTWEWQEELNQLEPDQVSIEFDEEGIISLKEITKEDGWLVMTLHPEKRGFVVAEYKRTDTGEVLYTTCFHVSPTGIITDQSTANFTNYRVYHLNMCLLLFAISILLWASFVLSIKELRFSYQSIFYSGLAIWVTLITILVSVLWTKEELMVHTYAVIQKASGNFMVFTFLPLLLFCLALSMSNISLIRHEGFRTRNLLGIIISIVMIGGIVVDVLLNSIYPSGSETQMRIVSACTGVYCTFYAFMECFLIGAVICGTWAARHEPRYDKDYLIILGCKVAPDGSLYPLIRGRVDRAIAFYEKQLEKTGKKAVFVPSGGQGTDEIISEADAMKKYLLEKGIPEEQILVENQSKNTLQNMKFSKKLIEERTPDAKTAFSTTNFHVFRSGIISRQNDFEPDGMGSPTKWYFWPNAYMREVIGMMSYKWKSIIVVLVPITAFLFISHFWFPYG